MAVKKRKSSAAAMPERSLDARMDALKRANDIRGARAELKRNLRRGHLSIREVLADPPEFALTAKVLDLLLAAPKFGRVRSNRILNQARISPSKTVGGLSERQRSELISLLGRARATQGETEHQGVHSDQAEFLLQEMKRIVGRDELSREALERAARLAAAEQSWRFGLGALLTVDDVSQVLKADPDEIAQLEHAGELIVLPGSGGADRYPAFQFQDGKVSPTLAHAHSLLVEEGRVSPWTAASWARTSHPELEDLSPAQWAGTRQDAAALMQAAKRDASRLAQ